MMLVVRSSAKSPGRGAIFPLQVEPVKDRVDDPIHTGYVYKAQQASMRQERFEIAAITVAEL